MPDSALVVADLWDLWTPTPVSGVEVRYRGTTHWLLLKDESRNPTGSAKDRTAVGLLRTLDSKAPIRPGTVIIESTSGNLGLALAGLASQVSCRVIAVIDSDAPDAVQRRLQSAGAEVVMASLTDHHGGHLLRRLRLVRELCLANPHYRWTNQYASPGNPSIHQQTTGPEIIEQGGPGLDAVYVAVSTGGTLAGIAAHVRRLARPIRLIAVDAPCPEAAPPEREGARVDEALSPGARFPGSRLIPAIGVSYPSSFLRPESFDRRIAVGEEMAIAMCRILREDTGIGLGGSSGCVLSACVQELGARACPRLPLCLAADDSGKYESTIYDDGWLMAANALTPVKHAIDQYRVDGLAFRAEICPAVRGCTARARRPCR